MMVIVKARAQVTNKFMQHRVHDELGTESTLSKPPCSRPACTSKPGNARMQAKAEKTD
eukprot:CAMPEP_0177532830 /NCGR_PEP_ID=MMETSP0369-20130122/54914_1 /TAXON_ID=447022 ORGANISM="Scrippsiella hangoei-like, Strain SHHI-4" /NCGR_SAMPLE_ID=MMETSP0369 /ASSEMBLY_ACC=CAM_ASM_000364 /LENGTH=57 /DNA_ID=CAMNT_0019014323 /DNA_START=118 /DNA_END=288 /DNA_ORIENTATION=+